MERKRKCLEKCLVILLLVLYGIWKLNAASVCTQHKRILNETYNGIITDGAGSYLSNQRCEWLIASPTPSTHPYISLRFTKRSTECMFDYINIYDGISYYSPILATYSGNATLTKPVVASSANMLVYMFSDSNYTLSGFEAVYSIDECPSNCNGNGKCNDQRCECDYNWSGYDCSQPACPFDCMNPHNGRCLFDETYSKKCLCKKGFIGLGCGMDTTASQNLPTLTTGGGWWIMVYNYTGESGSEPRAGHAGVFVEPYYYTFGGYNLNKPLGNLLRYNFEYNDWLLYTTTFQPAARFFHTLSAFRDDEASFLLLFGGDYGNDMLSDELWSYNINAATWIKHQSIGKKPPALCQHTATVVRVDEDDYLYIYGGRESESGDLGLSSIMFRLRWKSKFWEEIIPDPSGVKSSRLRVAGHSTVYNKHDHTLVVYGGFRMDERQKAFRSNTVYIFDIKRNIWIDIQPSSTVHSLIPDKLAFHQAVVVGDYMVVHGGNIHVHQLKEQCYGVLVYLYHLRCHTWTLLLNSDIEHHQQAVFDYGRYAHVATLMHDRVLLVHGGYSGTMSRNLLAFKLPNFVVTSPRNASQASEMCRKILSITGCNRHPYCVWCDFAFPPISNCMPVNEASRSCLRNFNDKCPGICPLLKTCDACAGHQNSFLNPIYTWSSEKCRWCVQDATCQRSSVIAKGLCGTARSSYSRLEPWWKLPYLAEDQDVCLNKNIPPGVIASEHFPMPDVKQPDKVFLVQERMRYTHSPNKQSYDLKRYSSGGEHLILLRGFVHPQEALKNNERFQMQLSSTNGILRLYMSANDDDSKPRFIASVPQSGGLTETVSPILHPVKQDEKYYFHLTYTHTQSNANEWSGNFELEWNGKYKSERGARVAQFRPLYVDFIEAYSSINCAQHTNCLACLTDTSCAWCHARKSCINRSEVGTTNCFHSYMISKSSSAGVIADPDSCWTCPDYGTCAQCSTDEICLWYNDRCVRKTSLKEIYIKRTDQCNDICSSKTSCETCLSAIGVTCSWCQTTQKCYRFSAYHLAAYTFGQCAFWVDNKAQCINCEEHITCGSCLQTFQCGWCSDKDNPLSGACKPGGFRGPRKNDMCEDVGDVSMQWDYSRCPDVDECITEWPVGSLLHDCHARADCVNTDGSFMCVCQRGFAGNGTHCVQTCNITCVHGQCSGFPLYECICDIGWTSDTNAKSLRACDISCGCNFHSTCQHGICDECMHNTAGAFCEKCLPGYHYDNVVDVEMQLMQNCVPCNCNGHGDTDANLCDPVTGRCYCLHHTTGDTCDKCEDGYYGDPRNGGTCYLNCNGRSVITEPFGAFGIHDNNKQCTIVPQLSRATERTTAWNIYCHWWIRVENSTIELTFDKGIVVPCLFSSLAIYDGVYKADSENILLAKLCGNVWLNNINVISQTDSVSVIYHGCIPTFPSHVQAAFNATFVSRQHCSATNTTQDQACSHGLLMKTNCSEDDCEKSNPAMNVKQIRTEYDTTIALSRFGHSMSLYADNLWIFGGFSTNYGSLSDVVRYNLKQNSWHFVEISNTSNIPAPRYFHQTVIRELDGTMLVHGGVADGNGEIWKFQLSDALQGNPASWERHDLSDDVSRIAGHTLSICNGDINKGFVIGGYSEAIGYNTRVWHFDLIDIRFSAMYNVHGPSLYGHTSVCHGGSIYVFGGAVDVPLQYPQATNDLHEYDIELDSWQRIYAARTLTPKPTAFHASANFIDDYGDGMLVFGGRSIELRDSNDVWLYRFKCNIWTKLSNEHDESFGSGVASVTDDNGVVYIHGGYKQGRMDSTLVVVENIDPCRTADDIEHCEMLMAGCSYCEDPSIHPKCYKATEHEMICNASAISGHKFIQMCDVAEPIDCTQISSCRECISQKSLLDGSGLCKMCGSCVPVAMACIGSDHCATDICANLSRHACSLGNECEWTRHKEIDHRYNVLSYTWDCQKSPTVSENQILPNGLKTEASCGRYTTCFMCVQSGESGTWNDCVWSEKLQLCMEPDYAMLKCWPGAVDCGRLMFQGAQSCPVESCGATDYCLQCIATTSCGWIQNEFDSMGIGSCVKGNVLNSSVALASSDTWWWAACPLENECMNDRHICLDNPVDHEVCVDMNVGYKCDCAVGFNRTSSSDSCKPVCSKGCIHGSCVDPDMCECAFGYVGEDCAIPCQCNGHSQCEDADNLDRCLSCRHNTTGEQCQYCAVDFVGDPTKDISCKPCQENCNMRSTKCISTSAISRGPTPTEVECQQCSRNTEGKFCERCKEGYFMLNGSCRTCMCNGHSTSCDRNTGSNCKCRNNTESSMKQCQGKSQNELCWQYQCDACMTGFDGNPTNDGHCFRRVLTNQEWCFNPSSQATCLSSTDLALPSGQAIMFSLQPRFMNVNLRLMVDVTYGEVDVYLTTIATAITIRSDSSGRQFIEARQQTMNRTKRAIDDEDDLFRQNPLHFENKASKSEYSREDEEKYSNEEEEELEETKVEKKNKLYFDTLKADDLNTYVSLHPTTLLHVESLHNRLVVTIPYLNFDMIDTKFYLVIIGKRYEQLVTHGNHDNGIVQPVVIDKASGRIFFRQDQTHIDLFVFFSVFFSCFFLMMTIFLIVWKVKRRMEARLLLQNNIMQMHSMASRPFASVYVYFEKRPNIRKISKPVVLSSKPPKVPRFHDNNSSNSSPLALHRKSNLYRSASSSFIAMSQHDSSDGESDVSRGQSPLHPFSVAEVTSIRGHTSSETAGPSRLKPPSIMRNSTSNIPTKTVSFAKHVSILNEAEHLESLEHNFAPLPVCYEVTKDKSAAVATVVLLLPRPSFIRLGSALVSNSDQKQSTPDDKYL